MLNVDGLSQKYIEIICMCENCAHGPAQSKYFISSLMFCIFINVRPIQTWALILEKLLQLSPFRSTFGRVEKRSLMANFHLNFIEIYLPLLNGNSN